MSQNESATSGEAHCSLREHEIQQFYIIAFSCLQVNPLALLTIHL